MLDVLKTGGVIATYSSMTNMTPAIPFVRMMFMDTTIRMVLVYAMPDDAKQQAIEDITNVLSGGNFDHRIAGTFPLKKSVKAHNEIERGDNYGSIIITIS